MLARSCRLGCTGLPRSSIVDETPASAKRSAAHDPAGPEPTITTRGLAAPAGHGRISRFETGVAASPLRRTSTRKRWPSEWALRASSERRMTRTSKISSRGIPILCETNVAIGSSLESSGIKRSTTLLMIEPCPGDDLRRIDHLLPGQRLLVDGIAITK